MKLKQTSFRHSSCFNPKQNWQNKAYFASPSHVVSVCLSFLLLYFLSLFKYFNSFYAIFIWLIFHFTFAISHLPFAICLLPLCISHLPFAIFVYAHLSAFCFRLYKKVLCRSWEGGCMRQGGGALRVFIEPQWELETNCLNWNLICKRRTQSFSLVA